MKSLFIECNMGIAGDMLNAALWELIADKEGTLQEIKKIGIPKTNICFEKAVTCGISGTSAKVIIDGWEEGNPYPSGYDSHHKHKSLSEINSIIDGLNVSNSVKEKSKSVYSIIANAESKVHNADVSAVHFHELGMLDAIADVVVSSFLIDKLRLERITVSPINVGSGSVKCAHGVLPVPAPAAAEILKGVPYYKSEIKGELCTPTGAALIKAFADEFSQMPTMTVEKIGYGIGSKKFEQANFVR
ncbi:MAG: LarC family nickel insertion protein, partial [Eubacterium sp.]